MMKNFLFLCINELQVYILNSENGEDTENNSSINLIVENTAFSSNNNDNKTIKAVIKSNKNVEMEFTHDEQINDKNLVIEGSQGSVKKFYQKNIKLIMLILMKH